MLRTHALALPLLIVLALTGCGSPPVALEPEPTAEPLFASDEEALAAAIEVYEGFQSEYNRLAQASSVDDESLGRWSRGPYMDLEIEGLRTLNQNGWTQVGANRTSNYALVEYAPDDPMGMVTIRFCNDISSVDIVDRAGDTVLPEGRSDLGTMVATFDLVNGSLILVDRVLEADGC